MKKTMALLLVLVLSVLGSVGCSNSEGADNPKNVAVTAASGVVDYGNNVYYFVATKANFGNKLVAFLNTHPDLEVSAMAGDGTSAYGWTVGYFVTFRPKTESQK